MNIKHLAFCILLLLAPQANSITLINSCNIDQSLPKHLSPNLDRIINIVICGSPNTSAIKNAMLNLSSDKELRKLSENLNKLEASYSSVQADIKALEKKVDKNEEDIVTIQNKIREFGNLKKQFLVNITLIKKLILNSNEETVKATITAIEKFKREVNLNMFVAESHFSQRVTQVELEITRLNLKVFRLETDVSYLMKQYKKGDFVGQISFLGLSLASKVGDWDSAKIALEYEIYNQQLFDFNYFDTYFIEMGHFLWHEESVFQALPNQEVLIISDDNSYSFVGMGVKKFNDIIKTSSNSRFYWGTAIGKGLTGEQPWYLDFFSGFEFYRKRVKYNLELRINTNKSINEQNIDFNPLGQSQITERTKSQSNLMLLLKVYFR